MLDPADAPRPPIWEPRHEGLPASQIAKNFHGLRRLDIIGGDIVCIILAKIKSNNITNMNAMAMMFDMVALIADNMDKGGKD